MNFGRIDPADAAAMMKYWYTYRGAMYAGLVFNDPYTVTDPLTVEILGAAYRRPLLVLTQTGAAFRNSAELQWSVPPMTRISGIAGFDAPFNGKVRFYTPLAEPVSYPAGGVYKHAALDLAVALDV